MCIRHYGGLWLINGYSIAPILREIAFKSRTCAVGQSISFSLLCSAESSRPTLVPKFFTKSSPVQTSNDISFSELFLNMFSNGIYIVLYLFYDFKFLVSRNYFFYYLLDLIDTNAVCRFIIDAEVFADSLLFKLHFLKKRDKTKNTVLQKESLLFKHLYKLEILILLLIL